MEWMNSTNNIFFLLLVWGKLWGWSFQIDTRWGGFFYESKDSKPYHSTTKVLHSLSSWMITAIWDGQSSIQTLSTTELQAYLAK